MFNRWESWNYSNDSNCWDLVRSYLSYRGVPDFVIPKFGIIPDDKKAMTKAHRQLESYFPVIDYPVDNAVACQYRGRVFIHVGVVVGDKVLHSNKHGTFKSTFEEFAQKYQVKYRLYNGNA